MANEKRLVDVLPLMQNGWHLTRTGKSNVLLDSMSLADVPTVDAVEVVHGRWWWKSPNGWACSACGEWGLMIDNRGICKSNYCPNCGAKMNK